MKRKSQARSPGREGYPMSLQPLTPEEALRRAMQTPPPAADPKPAKAAAKKAAPKKPAKKK